MGDTIDFMDLNDEAQKFISSGVSYAVDDLSTKSAVEDQLNDPMVAATTLLESSVYNQILFDEITCRYSEVKNVLSKDELEAVRTTILANAYQYGIAYATLKEGFASANKVLYINPSNGHRFLSEEELVSSYESGGLMFLTVTRRLDKTLRGDLHLICFSEKHQLLISSEELNDLDWISYDWDKDLP